MSCLKFRILRHWHNLYILVGWQKDYRHFIIDVMPLLICSYFPLCLLRSKSVQPTK